MEQTELRPDITMRDKNLFRGKASEHRGRVTTCQVLICFTYSWMLRRSWTWSAGRSLPELTFPLWPPPRALLSPEIHDGRNEAWAQRLLQGQRVMESWTGWTFESQQSHSRFNQTNTFHCLGSEIQHIEAKSFQHKHEIVKQMSTQQPSSNKTHTDTHLWTQTHSNLLSHHRFLFSFLLFLLL